jgi:hypothetical protein
VWATGVYHDASNSRPEFSESIHQHVGRIRRQRLDEDKI